jgi:hypothetical protein
MRPMVAVNRLFYYTDGWALGDIGYEPWSLSKTSIVATPWIFGGLVTPAKLVKPFR